MPTLWCGVYKYLWWGISFLCWVSPRERKKCALNCSNGDYVCSCSPFALCVCVISFHMCGKQACCILCLLNSEEILWHVRMINLSVRWQWANEWMWMCVSQSREVEARVTAKTDALCGNWCTVHTENISDSLFMLRSFGCRHPVYARTVNDVKSSGMSLISFNAATKAHRAKDWQIRHTCWQHRTANKKDRDDRFVAYIELGGICRQRRLCDTHNPFITFGLFELFFLFVCFLSSLFWCTVVWVWANVLRRCDGLRIHRLSSGIDIDSNAIGFCCEGDDRCDEIPCILSMGKACICHATNSTPSYCVWCGD